MSRLRIMIGLPRSGKTTWVNSNKEENEVVVSADTLRELIYGQRWFKEGEPYVWSVRGTILHMLMLQGVNIIIDETNILIRNRSVLRKFAKKYGYVVEYIYVATSKEKCIERAKETEREDLIPIIERMEHQWNTAEYISIKESNEINKCIEIINEVSK
jgi:predicted kinase